MSKRREDRDEPPPIDEAALMKSWRKLLHDHFKIHLSGDWFTAMSLKAFRTKAWSEAYGGVNNERLEWLGDAVCAFYGALFIIETMSGERRLRVLEHSLAQLTTGAFQREIAAHLRLDKLALIPEDYVPVIRTGRLETRAVLLGNVFEALVGTVFLQSHEATKKILERVFRRELQKLVHGECGFKARLRTGLTPRTTREWLGYYTLRLITTLRLYESDLGLYEAHVARDRALRIESVAMLADAMKLRRSNEPDVLAASRVLDVAGSEPGNSLTAEPILHISNEEFDRFCRGQVLRSAPIPPPPETIEPAPTKPMTALRTILNGHVSRLLPRRYREEDGRTRIELAFNGVVLGVGVHNDPEKAEQLAAHDALNNDRRATQLARARTGKY